jgi:hypothetical protein
VLIQANLLHSWWFTSTNDQKDPWHWQGISISLAIGLGLNQPGVHAIKDMTTRRLWRRIWWTIVARDRIMSFCTRKPMRLMEFDLKLPRLTFQDFDTQPVQCTLPAFQKCAILNDCVTKVMLADIFMSQLNVLLIGGRIIAHLYNLQGFAASNSEWAMWYAPKKKSDLRMTQVDQLHNELAAWSAELNNYCRFEYHHSAQGGDELGTKILRINTGALKLLHLLTQETLHRPLMFPAGLQQHLNVPPPTDDDSTTRARSEVCQVASKMAETFTRLREEQLLEYVPPLSLACLIATIASLLVEIKLVKRSPADFPEHPYHECVRSLLSLRDVWPLTKGSCAMVNQMANNNQVWYARSLKMLAQPTPTAAIQSSAEIVPTPGARTSAEELALPTAATASAGSGSAPCDPDTRPLDLDTLLDSEHNGSSSVPGQSATTYLASMYPFLWTEAEFDIFGPSTCQDLFSEHDISSFNVGGEFDGSIS